MVTRTAIVQKAREYLRVKWVHQGRSKKYGIDCAGLPVLVASDLGIHDYDFKNYSQRPDGSFLVHFDRALTRKPISEAKEGDVLIFSEAATPCHCGIQSTQYGKPAVIHSHLLRGRVVEETLESARSVIGQPLICYQFPEVED